MKTEFGTFNVGEVYVPADGSKYEVVIVDTDTYYDQGDIVIKGPNGIGRRIDWFKFSYRYKKK